MFFQQANMIPIVESTASKVDFGLKFAFWNWNYMFVAVDLKAADFMANPGSIMRKCYLNTCEAASSPFNRCIDIRCRAILID